MVTGASTADLAIILVDARKGMLEQSRRHAFLSTLLGIPHLVVAINKMDLVDWSEQRYEEIKAEFERFAQRLQVHDITTIPVSALQGDNVVDRSENMPWFTGLPLLTHLENIYVASDRNLVDTRFPVQYVIRPMTSEHHDYRGFAGTVAGGVLRPGDEVVVLPSGFSSRIKSIDTSDGPVEEAFAPMAVTLTLEDEIDISRGDMIARPHNQPTVSQDLDAMVCWMSEAGQLSPTADIIVKHTTRTTKAKLRDVAYKLDINTLHRDEAATSLGLNDIGRVQLRTQTPLFTDSYTRNKTTGSFILIDPATNNTVGAGMVVERQR
jgi:bifunctional enzyme CysN/CysC